MSFPVTLVRASYAGYFPPTVFATLVIVLLPVDRDDAFSLGPLPLAFAAAFAAMLNHKAVVLVLAVVALAGLDAVVRVAGKGDSRRGDCGIPWIAGPRASSSASEPARPFGGPTG